MPVTLICVNGHQTTVRDDLAGRTLRCPECGEPVAADRPTAVLSETPGLDEELEVGEPIEPVEAAEAAEPAPRPRPRRAAEPAGRRWVRPVVLAVGLLAVAGVALGVYRLTRPGDPAPDPARDREAARETVVRFLDLSRRGDEKAALELLTDRAREEIRKGHGRMTADLPRSGETRQVGDAIVTGDTADVPVTVREAGQDQQIVIKVRRQGADWRVYAFSFQLFPGEPDSRMTFDLENPQNMAKDLFGADMEAMGKDFAKEMEANFNKGIENSFKSEPRPDDLANEALAPTDREAFEATWKADLDVKDRPAGELLKELADEMGVELKTTPAQGRALARPVTLQLRGRSRPELAEEVCRRVGLYPAPEEQFGADGKQETMSLRSAPRPHPVAFAGPFTIEVTEVTEYVPNATGMLTFRVRAADLPPVVAKMIERGQDRDTLVFKQVTDPAGRDLSDAPTGPGLKFGRVLPDGYDRTLEFPLKNLLRDVTAVKTLRGTVRVPLPIKVESLRIEPPAAGAVAKAGAVEIKMTSFRKDKTTFQGKQYPNARFGLEYKGIRPDRVRALAYDAQKKLIAVSSSGSSGTDQGGTGEFSVQGDPAAVVVKVITEVGHAEYDFALDGIPLPGAAGMPEKLVPATFPGHDAPVTAEFVRITAPQFPAKAQFRLVNHSDKDVRLVDLKLAYLDAAGRETDNWPSVTYPGPTLQDRKGPPLAVGKKATAVVEIGVPFLPDTAKSIRAGVNKVEYADATGWAAPKK